jgi:hypothetical protein
MIGQLKSLRAGQRISLRITADPDAGVDLTTVTSATLLVRDRALKTAQVEWATTIAPGTTAGVLTLSRVTDGTEQGDYVWCARLFVSGVLLVETVEDRKNLIVFTPSAFTE